MFLSKAPNGYYHLWYVDENGKRQKRSGRTKLKSEALRRLTGLDLERRLKPHSVLLSEFTTDCLQHARSSFSPSTVDIYVRAFSRFVELHEDLSLASINARHIDKYNVHRRTSVREIVHCHSRCCFDRQSLRYSRLTSQVLRSLPGLFLRSPWRYS